MVRQYGVEEKFVRVCEGLKWDRDMGGVEWREVKVVCGGKEA